MKSTDILFRTDRFNLSEVKPDFINDCCFGEDLGEWLRGKLGERGVQVDDLGQEDWGWLMSVTFEGQRYSLGLGGNSDEEPGRPNYGEWRVMVERPRSLKERLLGGKGDGKPMADLVLAILAGQPDFSGVGIEK